MQGIYSPMTLGWRPNIVDGKLSGFMVGPFDPDWVTHEDFSKLREEFQSQYDLLKVHHPITSK